MKCTAYSLHIEDYMLTFSLEKHEAHSDLRPGQSLLKANELKNGRPHGSFFL